MKNQVIKKIMAYLLAGAMIVTTPMVAFADEIADAFSGGEGLDFKSNSRTSTNSDTNTNSNTNAISKVDPEGASVIGIALDKYSLEFNSFNEDKSVKDTLIARVLFDNYDASGDALEWATAADQQRIENQIKWYSHNPKVARAVWDDENTPAKATVYAVGEGEAKVTAWIEADGQVYTNNPGRPTLGDFQATAVITVSNKVKVDVANIKAIEFKAGDAKFYQKHTYDLKDYTNFVMTDGTEIPANQTSEKLVYSLSGTTKAKVTLNADGTLTATKATAADSVSFDIVYPAKNKTATGSITFKDAIEATKVTAAKTVELDLGESKADTPLKNSEEVSVSLTYKKGGTPGIVDTATPVDDRKNGTVCTDFVTWTSKNPKIADVEATSSDLTGKIVAKGVGTTTITAKATGGKSASIKVTVYATPSKVVIKDVNKETIGETWTGKPTKLTAVLIATRKNDKGETEEFEIPAGSTKFKWVTGDKKVASVSGKDVATVKPANQVDESDGKNKVTISVEASGKSGKIKYGDKKDIKAEYTLTVKQSNISNITIGKLELKDGKMVPKTIVSASDQKNKTPENTNVGAKTSYEATPTNPDEVKFADSIGWTISGAAATVDEKGNLEAVKAGKATLTASYVSVDARERAKLNKKTVSIAVIQNATSIAFAKAETVINPSATKVQKVTLKVNAVEPKKSTLNVAHWKATSYTIKDNDTATVEARTKTDAKNTPVNNGTDIITKATKNSVTVSIPAGAKEGSVIKVGAYTDGGITAFAYIYVTEKTSKVEITEPLSEVKLGETESIGTVMLNVGKKADGTPDLREVGSKDSTFGTKGNTTAYIREPVTYSVDKKSAMYISVDQDGKVTGLQQTGNKTATVTIQTISGKKTTVKVKVTAPAAPAETQQ